jgi:hypothetical protein
MSREARAIIRWVPAARGGRNAPPPDAVGYTCPPQFESDPAGTRGSWSLRIVSAVQLRGPEVIDARVRFVVDEAPHDLLREGERFELMEGRKVVAKCVVLPETLAVPAKIGEFELALLG